MQVTLGENYPVNFFNTTSILKTHFVMLHPFLFHETLGDKFTYFTKNVFFVIVTNLAMQM